MSTKTTISCCKTKDEVSAAHLYHDMKDYGDNVVNLHFRNVDVELEASAKGDSHIFLRIPCELAEGLGLLPSKSSDALIEKEQELIARIRKLEAEIEMERGRENI